MTATLDKTTIAQQFGQMLFVDIAHHSEQLGIDQADVLKGFVQAMESKATEATADFDRQALTQQLNELAQGIQAEKQAEMEAGKKEKEAENKTVIDAFMKKVTDGADDITKTESGISYEVITEGTGEKPASAEVTVQVHYEGSLEDGTIFDSSIIRGEPIEFGLSQVIAGWTEAVQLMPTGSTFRFHIPWELAYGEQGTGSTIPPKANLIFLVELIAVR